MKRKTLLTPDRQRRLCGLLGAANSVVTACETVGLAPRTFHSWMARGAGEENGAYREFYCAVARARAEAKCRLIARIVAAAEKDWKAAAWTLEKLFPAEFGANADVEPTKNDSGIKIMFDTQGRSLSELLTFPIAAKDETERAELEAAQKENIAFWESQVKNDKASNEA